MITSRNVRPCPSRSSALLYGAGAAALAAAAPNALATIQWSGVLSSTPNIGSGTVHMQFTPTFDAVTGFVSPAATPFYFFQSGSFYAEIAATAQGSSYSLLNTTVAFGSSVNPSQNPAFYNNSLQTSFSNAAGTYYGAFKYNGNFGWLELSVVNGSTAHITQFAFEDSGAAIQVGAIPEPTESALAMTLGAAALVAMRRRRKAAQTVSA